MTEFILPALFGTVVGLALAVVDVTGPAALLVVATGAVGILVGGLCA